MALHLVRHAKAGDANAWDGEDELRPLSKAGLRQAEVLGDELGDRPIEVVLSSRYLRCIETVAPTAAKLALRVEEHDALAEEASLEDTWSLLEELAGAGTEAVLCSHGNVFSAVLDRLHRRGIDVDATEWSCRKGSVWRIETDADGAFVKAVLAVPQA